MPIGFDSRRVISLYLVDQLLSNGSRGSKLRKATVDKISAANFILARMTLY